MAALDVSCLLMQVETAIADLTNTLDQLPEEYREDSSRQLQILTTQFTRLMDMCLDPQTGKSSGRKIKTVRNAGAGRTACTFRSAPGFANRVPARGGKSIPLYLLENRDRPRSLSDRPAGEAGDAVANEVVTGVVADDTLKEERFRLICNAVNGIVYDWNLKTDQVYWSKGLQKNLRIAPDKGRAVYAWWFERIHPDDQAWVRPVVDEIRQGKRDTYELQYRVMDQGGRWMAVWDQGSVARDAQGRPLFAAGLCQDVTRQKETEDTLRETNQALVRSNLSLRATDEQFRVALANAPIAVFRTDAELRYTWFYHPQMGEQADRMIGKRDSEVLPYENVADLTRLKREALEGGKPLRKEICFLMKNQPRYLIVNLEPLFGPDRQPAGLIGAYTDITDLRRLESQEREKNFRIEVDRRLMEHREMERQKLAFHLHEGPIQALSGLTFSLHVAREMAGEGEASGVIGQISDELKRSIVDLRQVTYELRPAGLARFGLAKAIQRYAEDFQERYPQIKVQLSLESLANRLPENDSLVLFRILQESFTNVARHAGATQIAVTLRVESRRVRMEIQDNGQGFNIHYDWLKLIRRGCFGLVGMKERAEAIGGKLKVRSIRNEGTTVQVVVPQEKSVPQSRKA